MKLSKKILIILLCIVCVLAYAASLEELAIHLRQKRYCADVKSILQLARKSKLLSS